MKISKILLDYASDFIESGNTTEEKQNNLNVACTAWNLALLEKEGRKKALKKTLKFFKRHNQNQDELKNFQYNLDLLIKKKRELFPEINKTIINAELIEEGNQYKIIAASISND